MESNRCEVSKTGRGKSTGWAWHRKQFLKRAGAKTETAAACAQAFQIPVLSDTRNALFVPD